MIAAKNCNTAMVIAAECENNVIPDEMMGIRETGSAFILDTVPSDEKGFSRFLFSYHPESMDAYTTYYKTSEERSYLKIEKDTRLNELYVDCIFPAVQQLLQAEGIDINKIDIVFPPQISSGFILRLSDTLGISQEKFIDVVGEGADLFSSSLAYAFKYACEKKLVGAGDTALMISVGAGLQVGCAIYHF
jgi:3-oxoacyl-[acyl-carrier-protein] synthase III